MFTIVVDVLYRKMTVQILFCSELYFSILFVLGQEERVMEGESDDAPSVHSGCTMSITKYDSQE